MMRVILTMSMAEMKICDKEASADFGLKMYILMQVVFFVQRRPCI